VARTRACERERERERGREREISNIIEKVLKTSQLEKLKKIM